jgi:hypothetical protein
VVIAGEWLVKDIGVTGSGQLDLTLAASTLWNAFREADKARQLPKW